MDILKATDEIKKALEGECKLSSIDLIGVCKRVEDALKFLKESHLEKANEEFAVMCTKDPDAKTYILDGATATRYGVAPKYVFSEKVSKLNEKVVKAKAKVKEQQDKEKADGTAQKIPGTFDPRKNSAFAVKAIPEKYPVQMQVANA